MFVVGGIQVAVTPENSVVAKGYNMSFTIEMTQVRALHIGKHSCPNLFLEKMGR